MTLRKQQPIEWKPTGVSDTVDGGNVFMGAMTALKDLVPDPSTANVFVPRPAATIIADFADSTISSPGFISVYIVVGDYIYGMISTDSPVGKDVPFVYDLDNGIFITVTGYNAGNTPDSPATSGAWVPPTMAVVGTNVVLTHPGFLDISPLGFIDISDPLMPEWSSGNTSPVGLTTKPNAVKEFAGRAYYAVGNTSFFSDILEADTISKSTQSITHGDDSNIIGYGAIPLKSLTAGNVESLMVFKPKTIFQVTGDVALNTLLNSEVSTGIGTESPLSISSGPNGLMFISQHGLRIIAPSGEVSPVIGADGSGVSIPFINSLEPSRIAAAFNVNTYRVSTQNSFIPTLPYQDWWYNTDLGIWTGPHSFPSSGVEPWGGTFIIAPQGVTGSLWQSDIVPLDSSSYIENGNILEFLYQTALMPDGPTMNEMNVIESSVALQYSKTGGTINFFAQDEDAFALDTVSKTITVDASVWGDTDWGTSQWGGNVTKYQEIRVPWTKPLTFSQASFGATGQAVNGFKIGAWNNRYQMLGYMTQR